MIFYIVGPRYLLKKPVDNTSIIKILYVSKVVGGGYKNMSAILLLCIIYNHILVFTFITHFNKLLLVIKKMFYFSSQCVIFFSR